MLHLRRFALLTVILCAWMATSLVLTACTGVTLRAKDGTIVYGRTMEWGTFDLHSRVNIISRGFKFTGQTPDGKPGLTWTAKYGVVGIDGVMKDIILDGMNEKGMTVGLFYHPGFAEYQKYDPAQASDSIGPTDVGQYLLSTCETIEEARQALRKIHVVPVPEAALGFVPPVHYMVTDPTGKQIVIEFLKGEMKIFDAPLGVITNAPNYDWHETNLRNYINLSPVGLPDKKIGELDFKALGGGSGMIGLPGDFTPPSRFIRAVAFSKSARPTVNGEDTMYELFRILDNFNVPLGAAEGSGHEKTQGMVSSTLWTTCYDTKNKVMYYHTAHNRRVRKLELSKIDFTHATECVHLPLDIEKKQDMLDITPSGK